MDTQVDTKIQLIESEFGLRGFAIYVKLLQKTYSDYGYYLPFGKDERLLFAKFVGESVGLVEEVLNGLLKRSLLDKRVFESFEVLTSTGIQKRYITIMKQLRRSKIVFEKNYLLVDPKNFDQEGIKIYIMGEVVTETIVNSEETPVFSEVTPVNSEKKGVITLQTKRKEKKLKETKEKDRVGSFVSFGKNQKGESKSISTEFFQVMVDRFGVNQAALFAYRAKDAENPEAWLNKGFVERYAFLAHKDEDDAPQAVKAFVEKLEDKFSRLEACFSPSSTETASGMSQGDFANLVRDLA